MYQTSRGGKLSEEWVQWLLQCAMTRFPECIQITGHVLQSQQQVKGHSESIAQLQWQPFPLKKQDQNVAEDEPCFATGSTYMDKHKP